MEAFLLNLFVILFGLVVGSFLSVCIYRIPVGRYDYPEEEEHLDIKRETLSVLEPKRSFCPKCRNTLRFWHNIPLFSWLALRGKCQFCKAPISGRYPLVESISGFFSWMTFATFGLTPTALCVFAFCAALIVISFIDFDYYIIPNRISYPGTVIGVTLALLNDFSGILAPPLAKGLLPSLLGIGAGAGFLYVISEGFLRLRGKEGLGLGDVKLLAMTGAVFGPECSLCTIFVGSLIGSVLGIGLVIIKGRQFSQHLPFGPYLAAGTIVYLFNPYLTPPLVEGAPIARLLGLFYG